MQSHWILFLGHNHDRTAFDLESLGVVDDASRVDVSFAHAEHDESDPKRLAVGSVGRRLPWRGERLLCVRFHRCIRRWYIKCGGDIHCDTLSVYMQDRLLLRGYLLWGLAHRVVALPG